MHAYPLWLVQQSQRGEQMKINYKGNYPIHAIQKGKQITLNGREKGIEVDELPKDMTWVEVIEEPKAKTKSRKTAKKR